MKYNEREITTSLTMRTMLQNMGSVDTPGESFRLVVLGAGPPVTHVLAAGSEVLIGRSETATVRLDEESISRRHAILRLGDNITLEDLGSLNGTRVRDRALPKGAIVEVIPGETFEIGKVMCLVQRRGAEKRPARGLKPHSYIENRLDEEIEKGSDHHERIALARLHIEGALPPGSLDGAIERTLAPADLVGEYGPSELEVLFLDTSAADVETRLNAFALALRQHAKVRVGDARFPTDGRTAGALLEAANQRVLGAEEPQAPTTPNAAMARLRGLVERVAKSDISIVLHGETGVGKEVLARQIHKVSDRHDKPFVGLNCAALTETLLESELFGHERGAFSGAVATKPGLLEVAEHGTVFLDEIGEMSPAMQAKLLRVLEERQVMRVGGLAPRAIDVRFVSASHRDLEAEVDVGRFRQDLYFRLNGITLDIPPLRERVDEIEGLARGFLVEACRRQKRLDVPRWSAEALALLRGYAWPGNVRELRNIVERAVLLCTTSAIRAEHLPAEKMLAAQRPRRAATVAMAEPLHHAPDRPATEPMHQLSRTHTPLSVQAPSELASTDTGLGMPPLYGKEVATTNPQGQGRLKDAVAEMEREKIVEALRRCAGNQTKAAEMLGISRRTLLNRLDQFGLPRPRK